MGELSRIASQIKHYRELVRIATDCAGKNAAHRAEYLELAKQWTALADRLERGEPDRERAGPSNIQNYEAEAGPAGR
jgi:hypothetical protein